VYNETRIEVKLEGCPTKQLSKLISQGIKLKSILLLSLIAGVLLATGQLGYMYVGRQTETNYKVYIYYDERYPTSWYGSYTSEVLIRYLGEILSRFNVEHSVVDADRLKEVILEEEPGRSVLIFAQDVVPDTVWDGSPFSPLVTWFWNGATIFWTGDWEFHFIGHRDGTKTHIEGIEQVPFGGPVTAGVEAEVSATELGSRYIPSIGRFPTFRPFSEELLQGYKYEVYGHGRVGNASVIDPGLVRVRDGRFVKIGGTGSKELQAIDRAIYIAELLLNGFLGYNVDLTEGLTQFHPYDSGIVYILPSEASTPYWKRQYGDRVHFYAHANVSEYKNSILKDLDVISQSYRFIILGVPLEDTELFYHNLKQMATWAEEKGLEILYQFFPKWKFGPEWMYLNVGSQAHTVMIRNIRFLANFKSTYGISVWYGWRDRPADVDEIARFYNSLPKELGEKYIVWVDQPFVEKVVEAGLPQLADKLNLRVATELYSPVHLALYGSTFRRQIVVTGYEDAESVDEWRTSMERKLDYLLPPKSGDFEPRRLGVWIFWDENDGHGEKLRAYINGELGNSGDASPISGSLRTSRPTFG